MGLNIGIKVKRQYEAYMSYGCNPKGTSAEITEQVQEALHEKFPNAQGTYSCEVLAGKEQFEFDVRFVRYADGFGKAGYSTHEMYLALLDYVLSTFGVDYGIDIHVYHSP